MHPESRLYASWVGTLQYGMLMKGRNLFRMQIWHHQIPLQTGTQRSRRDKLLGHQLLPFTSSQGQRVQKMELSKSPEDLHENPQHRLFLRHVRPADQECLLGHHVLHEWAHAVLGAAVSSRVAKRFPFAA